MWQATKCPVCHMGFCPDVKEDVKAHLRYHDKYLNGQPTKLLKSDHFIWSKDNMRITVINQRSSLAQRKRAEDVARWAKRDTYFDFISYNADERLNEENIHVFILHKEERAVGFLTMIRKKEHYKTSWENYDSKEQFIELKDPQPIWGITMIWIIKYLRQQDLAKLLVKTASAHLGFNNKFAFLIPFTETGRKFAENCFPDEFYIF